MSLDIYLFWQGGEKRGGGDIGVDIYIGGDKRIHFLPQLSDFVPLRNGFYSFRAQTG